MVVFKIDVNMIILFYQRAHRKVSVKFLDNYDRNNFSKEELPCITIKV